jgi:HAD superfamily hydrolase (TIGR01509 family)
MGGGMNGIDTILFDWDGTLIDTALRSFAAFQKAMLDLGIQLEFELYENIYSPNWYRMYQSLQLPEHKWQKAEDRWLHYFGPEPSPLLLGVRQALVELKNRGYCLGVVTSGSRSRVLREMNAHEVAELFGVVVCNEDVSDKKPNPEGLHKAMSSLDKQLEACCYVGDSADDVEMGKRAKVQTIGILSRYPGSHKLSAANPDFCFDSITQILGHFAAL